MVHLTRTAPPIIDPAVVRKVGPELPGDMGRQVQTSVLATLIAGQLNGPFDAGANLREAFARRVPEVGVQVCPETPCPDADATLRAFVTESTVSPQSDKHGNDHD